ncbi:tetratricopeptide repeat protein [Nonomuraea sp. NPDC047529]|uniref:tetratricopeptide repeat protein n=1 Tax=Nonomuraea sp. NPDC047529 TaxID=3155623 RepID=UPI0033F4D3BC
MVLVAFKVANPWLLGTAAAVGAVAVAVSGVWQDRHKRIATRRDEAEFMLQDGCLVLPSGRLPRVSQIDEPIKLGVHPAIVLGDSAAQNGRAPAYVPRDVDVELCQRLASGGFVLLVGDSAAGKSRTAFEAMRASLPDHLLIAPHDRTALPAAIERTLRVKQAVLWLSDLEHYLGAGGLTREHIARISGGSGHHRVILATLRSAEQVRLTSASSDGEDATRLIGREIREALEQADEFRLARMFTLTELERGLARRSDPRISSALEHAEEFGVAEYLASGPELKRDYDNAWDVGVNPRGAALVAAAIDCRRAGYTSPLPRKLLEELHGIYLDARGGHRLRPELHADAWDWATRPRRATTALLSPSPDTDGAVTVFDYVVDAVQQAEGPLAQVPEPVVRTALNRAQLVVDVEGIASTASSQGRYLLAEAAWRKALMWRTAMLSAPHPDTLTSRDSLALVLWGLGRLKEAEAEHRTVLKARRRLLGDKHPDTLASRDSLGLVLWGLGRLKEAEAEHRTVLEARRQFLGDQHPDTLISRNNLTLVLRGLGRLEEAEAENRTVLEARRQLLGDQHPDTLISWNNLARVLADLGRLEEAEAEQRAVLEARRRLLGDQHPDTLISRNNLGCVLANLGRLEEAEAEHRAVLEARRRVLDEDNPRTLNSRNNLARVLADLGRLEEAEAEHRAVLEARRRVLGDQHPDVQHSRNNLGCVLAGLGRLEEAKAEHRAALEARRRLLGDQHPDTLVSRNNLARVLMDLGRPEAGEAPE